MATLIKSKKQFYNYLLSNFYIDEVLAATLTECSILPPFSINNNKELIDIIYNYCYWNRDHIIDIDYFEALFTSVPCQLRRY